jgi:hypothetical protein
MNVSYFINESIDITQNIIFVSEFDLLICYATLLGNWYPDVSAEGWVKVKARCFFEASGITNQATRRHIPEGWNPRLHISENLSRIYLCVEIKIAAAWIILKLILK